MKKISLDELIIIINEVDSLGLYVDDATNKDEFLSEAKMILRKLEPFLADSKPTKMIIFSVVKEVFTSFFEGVEIKNEYFKEISEKIYVLISEN